MRTVFHKVESLMITGCFSHQSEGLHNKYSLGFLISEKTYRKGIYLSFLLFAITFNKFYFNRRFNCHIVASDCLLAVP